MSYQQRGHLETATSFTVSCEGREAKFYTIPTRNRTTGVAWQSTTQPSRQLPLKCLISKNFRAVLFIFMKEFKLGIINEHSVNF